MSDHHSLKASPSEAPRRLASAAIVAFCAALACDPATAQEKKYKPNSAYLMERNAEISMAKSAAPAHISDHATIKILTPHGYEIAVEGDNGFFCMVMRGWANSGTFTPVQFNQLGYDADIRAPVCFTPGSAKIAMPLAELKDKLGMEGKTPNEIAKIQSEYYAMGKLPRREGVTFAYMWSAHAHLNEGPDAEGTDLSHGWHPHMMVYAPYANADSLGINPFGNQPIVGDDANTPFAVIYIPVDPALFQMPH